MMQAGKTYRTADGINRECIFVDGYRAWCRYGFEGTAYVWNAKTGEALLGKEWDIVAMIVPEVVEPFPPATPEPAQVPMPSGDMGLGDGDKVRLVAWEDGVSDDIGEEFVVTQDCLSDENGKSWNHPSTFVKGFRPLFVRVPE
jgi:hypothetical protein